MKKALLTTALIAALGTSAAAQGIQPVTTAPTTDVTVGTLTGDTGIILAVVAGVAVLAAVVVASDGSASN